MQTTWAIITGASTGIGKAIVEEHAKHKGNAVIIARSEEKLKSIQQKIEKDYGVQIKVIAVDLTDESAIPNIMEVVENNHLKIQYLFNNAGFGGYGKFHERDWNKDQKMIRLNIEALSRLTHAIIPKMNESQNYILNVASTAAFMPGPLQATYFATKAFVVSFSQALDHELKEKNISVSALCPGPVDTGFAESADMKESPLFSNSATPEKVAGIAYKKMLKRRRLIFDDWKMAVATRGLIPFVPGKLVTKIVEKMQKI